MSDDKCFIEDRRTETAEIYTLLTAANVAEYAAYDLALKVLFDRL